MHKILTKWIEPYVLLETLKQHTEMKDYTFDGFYAVSTNLEDALAEEIVAVNKQRRQIEECFRIMKHEFKARPAYLNRDDRIQAHFMTCFLALILYRYLEKSLDNKYATQEIISTIKDMNVLKLEGYGYIPAFKKTEIIDELQNKYEIDLSKEIISALKMRNLCKITKNR